MKGGGRVTPKPLRLDTAGESLRKSSASLRLENPLHRTKIT